MSTEPDPREEAFLFLMKCVHTRNRHGSLNTAPTQQEGTPQPKRESVFDKIERLSNQGLSARQIGKRIGVSRKKVKKHLE